MFWRQLKRWEISASTGSHFDVLDGLRGVAILLVVSFHTFYTNPEGGMFSQLAGYIFAAGWMGVPVFFVLSGFLISHPFFKGRETAPGFWYQRGYAWRRMAKIFPPFYLSLIIFLVPCLWFQDLAALDAAWKWATGLANFIETRSGFGPCYWSLIVESHFYLLLPLLFWLTRGRTATTTGVVIFTILFFIPLLARHFTWPAGMLTWPDADRMYTCVWLFRRFPSQLDYFAWGVLFAGIYSGLGEARAQARALSVLGYAGAALMVVALLFWGYWVNEFGVREHPNRWSVEASHLLPALATMLMLFFVFDQESWGSKFLSQGWLRFTGLISYEWFLFHGTVVLWFHEHYGAAHGSVLAYAWRTLVPLAATFIFSALVYRYFSLPIMNRVRDRLKKNNHVRR